MALIINELTVQTKLVDDTDMINKEKIYEIIKNLEIENIKLRRQVAEIKEKLNIVGYL